MTQQESLVQLNSRLQELQLASVKIPDTLVIMGTIQKSHLTKLELKFVQKFVQRRVLMLIFVTRNSKMR